MSAGGSVAAAVAGVGCFELQMKKSGDAATLINCNNVSSRVLQLSVVGWYCVYR